MKMLTNRRTLRLVILAAVALVAVVLWSAQASAQPAKPPFLLYGTGDAGDAISVYDEMGEELNATTVDAEGNWHMSVNCASEKLPTLTFQLNGMAATPTINQTGADQAEISLTVSGDAMPDDSDTGMVDEGDAMADDEMMEDDMTEDGDEMMDEDDSSMMEESDDEMMADDDAGDEMADNGYPESGSGGLADESGPSTAALIGTVTILLALLLGLGAYRLRTNRA
ncbi:MAG: hypothetical protein OXI41_14875 [Chloroflexota bacterium]|nr:hypothetical protein [Chloroflexota bacterium]MDE2895852.1 hypothetical protein [Chloroflexota bacterium]